MNKKFLLRFISYWISNTLVLSLANSLYPDFFELGNANLNSTLAAVFSGFLLTVLLFLARGLARTQELPKKGRFVMFVYYWLAGSAGIWLIARIATVSGFGIARYTWAIAAGFATALSHWILRQALKGMKMVE